MSEIWVPWAVRVEGARQDKVYREPNTGSGIIWHRQEGTGLEAMKAIHNGNYRSTSFMFWISFDGILYQFCPVTSSVWTSGSRHANINYWPVEEEGFGRGPITQRQLYTSWRLTDFWEQYSGKKAVRFGPERNMLEHHEAVEMFGRVPTACPGHSYDVFWESFKENRNLDREEVEKIIADKLARHFMASSKRRDIRELADGPWKVAEEAWEVLSNLGFLRIGDEEERRVD